jgi:hypothetical protein
MFHRYRVLATFCTILLSSLAPAWAFATTWIVTGSGEPASVSSTNCTNGNDQCPTLRDAINTAATGDTIRFSSAIDGQTIALALFSNAMGCITTNATTCTSGSLTTEFGPSAFFITGGIHLTIDGLTGLTTGITIAGPGAGGPSSFRLFDVDSSGGLTLQGLTLSNGVAAAGAFKYGGGALGAGGAIFNQGTLDIMRCTFTSNVAVGGHPSGNGDGGGGVGQNGDASGNGAGPNGGAVALASDSFAHGGDGGFGGGGGFSAAPFGWAGAGGFGGGGGAYGGFAGGGHGGFGGGGGGGASPAYHSTAGFGGGAGSAYGGGGAGMGGAIFNDAGNVTIANSTFTGNSAIGGGAGGVGGTTNGSGYGGAIFNFNGSLSLSFVTVALNSVAAGSGGIGAGSADGAVYSLADSQADCSAGGNPCSTGGAILVINSSILANSIGATSDLVADTINSGTSSSSGSGNIVMMNSGYAGNIVSAADPLLSALGDFGGLSKTMMPQGDSFAVDAVACGGVTVDQRGSARPHGPQCDIGAVEYYGDDIFANGFE